MRIFCLLAGQRPGPASVAPFVGAPATLIQPLEDSNEQVQFMYDMTQFVLRGEMYNYGDQPYHDHTGILALGTPLSMPILSLSCIITVHWSSKPRPSGRIQQ